MGVALVTGISSVVWAKSFIRKLKSPRPHKTPTKLNTDYPESNQFDVCKGRVSGGVVSAVVVAQ